MITLTKLFDAAGGVCMYCGCDTYVPSRHPRAETLQRFGLTAGVPGVKKALRSRQATREHLVRVVDGGGDSTRNLGLSCQHCNITRGAATPEQHREAVARAVAAGIHPNHGPAHGLSKNALRKARRAAGLTPSEARP